MNTKTFQHITSTTGACWLTYDRAYSNITKWYLDNSNSSICTRWQRVTRAAPLIQKIQNRKVLLYSVRPPPWRVLFDGTVNGNGVPDFLVCGWNSDVPPFNWKLSSGTFLWCWFKVISMNVLCQFWFCLGTLESGPIIFSQLLPKEIYRSH